MAINLEGRFAVCGSIHNADHTTTFTEPNIVPSSRDLPFFQFRGIGSDSAEKICKNCHYHEIAHIPFKTHRCTKFCKHCKKFKKHGPWDYDTYYCGHGGLD